MDEYPFISFCGPLFWRYCLFNCKKHQIKIHATVIVLQGYQQDMGVQWLSGRVLDSRPRGRGFEPHRRRCVVVLEQDTFILA